MYHMYQQNSSMINPEMHKILSPEVTAYKGLQSEMAKVQESEYNITSSQSVLQNTQNVTG